MTNCDTEFHTYKRDLPHWRTGYVFFFVTWRLHKLALPMEPNERTFIADALKHYHGFRYWLAGYVVMDDHVHVVVRLTPEITLQKAVQNWKSFTSHSLMKISNREGSLWQPEYYDRIIRDEPELMKTLGYIVNNPHKRWPEIEDYQWCRVYEI